MTPLTARAPGTAPVLATSSAWLTALSGQLLAQVAMARADRERRADGATRSSAHPACTHLEGDS